MAPRGWFAFLNPQSGAEMPLAVRLFFAALTGAGLSLSFTGFYLQIYSWVSIGLLLILVIGPKARVAFFCGFLNAVAFVLTSVPWIATVLSVHGGLSPAGGWAVLLLIAAAWGILTGGFAWCVNRIGQRDRVLACIAAPFLWVTFEFIRAHLPEISFPWNLLGYPAATNLALAQLTTITGIYGLSFLVAAFNALIAWADVAPKLVTLKKVGLVGGVTAAILLVMLLGGRLVPTPVANHSARVVQPNFPEVESYGQDWFGTHQDELKDLEDLSLSSSAKNPDLIIWPEAPAPFSWQDQHFAKLASNIAIRSGKPFLAGTIEWKTEKLPSGLLTQVPYNSAVLTDPQGQKVFTYDKIHLVPFGEYEPFPLIHRVVASVSSEVGGFRKGTNRVNGTLPNGFKFGVYICYEAIYPGEIREFANHGANVLINISNDGWFGKSAAADQHLRMARVRAVENRRWLLRVTNNGITAAVDPYGRTYTAIPRDVRGAADLPYDFRTDKTLYTRLGDWFAWLCVLVSFILVGRIFLKKPSNDATM
ncbi:MAG: apolipoprotein N-acyltransferase [Acidobacteria bacterium]|nr:apolipoprotein N-acyltransferase [Acidobacteriota bacterium]MBS1866638.1 apolipoprotein N-acyltransferase [Acidobacteriota bacterium]